MTVFSVAIEVGHPVGGDLTQVSALVDTGAHHSMMPESLLEQLHIQPRLLSVISALLMAAQKYLASDRRELPYWERNGFAQSFLVLKANISLEQPLSKPLIWLSTQVAGNWSSLYIPRGPT